MSKYFIAFPGQGAQSLGMGKDFYDQSAAAKKVFEEANDIMGEKLSDIVFGEDLGVLTQTKNAQLAIMTTSIAMLKAIEEKMQIKLKDLDVIFAGHSLGEYSALHAAGFLSLKDAMMLLKERGDIMQKVATERSGGMAAVLGSSISGVEELVKELMVKGEGFLQIANDNTVGQIVISGDDHMIDQAVSLAKDYKDNFGVKRIIKLPVSGAFHSKFMDSAQAHMGNIISKINLSKSVSKVIPNFTAKPTSDLDAIKDSLVMQISGRVRWMETMKQASEAGYNNFLEIGPGSVISGLVKKSGLDFNVSGLNKFENLNSFIESNFK